MLIYKATNKVNGKCYVGQTTKTLNERMISHLSSARNNVNGTSIIFHNALNKYGFNNFEWEILEVLETEDRMVLDEREKFYIKECGTFSRNGYNMSEGGYGNGGLLGERNGMYGRKHTEESLNKMRKPVSKESLERMTNCQLRYSYIITLPTGEKIETNNLKGWCKGNNLYHSPMYDICNGKKSQHKGHSVERITKEVL
jgi:group I intron endonuclease